MKKSDTKKVIGALAMIWALAAGLALAGPNPNSRILPPHSQAFGMSYGDWGAAWWKWALSFPFSQSPVTDPDGRYGSVGQSGPVWFLAGNFGGVSERWVTIPAGKGIFFPLANFWDDWPCTNTPSFMPGPGQTLEQFLVNDVNQYVGFIDQLGAEVDGVPLQNLFSYRATSHLTPFVADYSEVAIDPCITGLQEWGVADGYWLMLAPLPLGQHTIHFTSGESAFGFSLDVTYHVTVK